MSQLLGLTRFRQHVSDTITLASQNTLPAFRLVFIALGSDHCLNVGHCHLRGVHGETGKELSGEEEGDPNVKASGVMIAESVLDEFVVMRLAEMIQEQKGREAVKRAISKWSGNGGCLALDKCAEQLYAALAGLEDNASEEV